MVLFKLAAAAAPFVCTTAGIGAWSTPRIVRATAILSAWFMRPMAATMCSASRGRALLSIGLARDRVESDRDSTATRTRAILRMEDMTM